MIWVPELPPLIFKNVLLDWICVVSTIGHEILPVDVIDPDDVILPLVIELIPKEEEPFLFITRLTLFDETWKVIIWAVVLTLARRYTGPLLLQLNPARPLLPENRYIAASRALQLNFWITFVLPTIFKFSLGVY